MKSNFYKLRRGKMVSGVLVGLSERFGFDVNLVRFLYALFTIVNFGVVGVILYVILTISMPYKEDIERERYGTGPRRRKEAEPASENDGWFW
ncbi:putative phage shock protein C / stress-responsive transcriptional regulator [Streptococcus sp. DD10]|uniref:PspC domain-containing protein n=1 Tax=Streptococcus sp. DD10 TaxID=1777878 RepID=UPI00079AEDDF|nr:PspC domain-containing protein [Streptococcus sp. DD10]KXT75202.1 putative phage shock protein C / stress-responsive transcriptional regulator [Streptococcus sp. DD10]